LLACCCKSKEEEKYISLEMSLDEIIVSLRRLSIVRNQMRSRRAARTPKVRDLQVREFDSR